MLPLFCLGIIWNQGWLKVLLAKLRLAIGIYREIRDQRSLGYLSSPLSVCHNDSKRCHSCPCQYLHCQMRPRVCHHLNSSWPCSDHQLQFQSVDAKIEYWCFGLLFINRKILDNNINDFTLSYILVLVRLQFLQLRLYQCASKKQESRKKYLNADTFAANYERSTKGTDDNPNTGSWQRGA